MPVCASLELLQELEDTPESIHHSSAPSPAPPLRRQPGVSDPTPKLLPPRPLRPRPEAPPPRRRSFLSLQGAGGALGPTPSGSGQLLKRVSSAPPLFS